MFFSLGLLAGVKMSGPIYGMLLVAILIILEGKRKLKGEAIFSKWNFDALFLLGVATIGWALFVGGFWFFRNWYTWGNPLGFVEVKLGLWVVFPARDGLGVAFGDPAKGTLWNLFEVQNLTHWKIAANQLFVWFSMAGLFMVLSIPMAIGMLFQNPSSVKKKGVFLVLFTIIATGFLYIKSPYTADNGTNMWVFTRWHGWQVRLGLPFFSLLMIAGSTCLRKINYSFLKLAAYISMVTGFVAITMINNAFTWRLFNLFSITGLVESGQKLSDLWAAHPITRPELLVYVGLLISFGILGKSVIAILSRVDEPATGKIVRPLVLAFIGMFFVVILLISADDIHRKSRQAVFSDMTHFLNEDIEKGSKIGYLFSHKEYYFFDEGFENEIIFIGFHERRSEVSLLNALVEQKVEYLAIGPLANFNLETVPALNWIENGDSSRYFRRAVGSDGVKEPVIFSFDWKLAKEKALQ